MRDFSGLVPAEGPRHIPLEGGGKGAFTAIAELASPSATVHEARASSALAKTASRSLKYWIVDTGAGHDIMGRQLIGPRWQGCIEETLTKYRVTTANGVALVSTKANLFIPVVNEVVQPMLMDESPLLL